MTEAEALLAELREVGVTVRLCDDGNLEIDSPRGALTEGMRAQLRNRKRAVVTLLREHPTWPCIRCHSPHFVFGTPGVVCFWCKGKEKEGAGRA